MSEIAPSTEYDSHKKYSLQEQYELKEAAVELAYERGVKSRTDAEGHLISYVPFSEEDGVNYIDWSNPPIDRTEIGGFASAKGLDFKSEDIFSSDSPSANHYRENVGRFGEHQGWLTLVTPDGRVVTTADSDVVRQKLDEYGYTQTDLAVMVPDYQTEDGQLLASWLQQGTEDDTAAA